MTKRKIVEGKFAEQKKPVMATSFNMYPFIKL